MAGAAAWLEVAAPAGALAGTGAVRIAYSMAEAAEAATMEYTILTSVPAGASAGASASSQAATPAMGPYQSSQTVLTAVGDRDDDVFASAAQLLAVGKQQSQCRNKDIISITDTANSFWFVLRFDEGSLPALETIGNEICWNGSMLAKGCC